MHFIFSTTLPPWHNDQHLIEPVIEERNGMLCFLNSFRHIVKTKVSFDAKLNELLSRQTNWRELFVQTKILSK